MIPMFLNVTNRTSSAVKELQVDALNKQAIVTFTNGNTYAYGNVSTRAIINVLFNEDVSLGFWVNNHLVQSDRAYVLSTDEIGKKDAYKRQRLNAILNNESYPNLPSFV
tara:strand:+ start:135 stop:461 length:327 start_codon:yes stop_codon:yes gene_type:complete